MNPTADMESFYAWAGARCHIGGRVSGSVKRLWCDYTSWCKQAGVRAERFAFVQWLATEFQMIGGLAFGICLSAEIEAYRSAYIPPGEVLQTARRIKVNFLARKGAANEERTKQIAAA